MGSLFQKFQQFVGTLAKSPTFAKDPRRLQFEADVNRLFLCTSYNRVGKDAEVADIDEIINLASKAELADQERQVQENIHSQITSFCTSMDEILLPDLNPHDGALESSQKNTSTPRRSGLSLAIGRNPPTNTDLAVPETKELAFTEVSQKLKDMMGYTLELKPSKIPHEQAGRGLFIDGEADVGSVIALYPGVIYSPAYYRYIPGYPRINAQNPYLITRYDGTVINAQPWGTGGETREPWGPSRFYKSNPSSEPTETGSDRVWKMLSKPLEGSRLGSNGEVLERRNPLALGHFANHPAKGVVPNVMVCPYDFPLREKDMRVYIPNIVFGGKEGEGEGVKMKRFGSFWFKSGGVSDNNGEIEGPIMKCLALVAKRSLCNEEIYLNYRLSNSKRRPSWYDPVDEEEDRRRWS